MKKFMKTLGKKNDTNGILFEKKCKDFDIAYAGWNNYKHENGGFRVEDCLSLHYFGWKLFDDERDIGKGDEMISTNTDKDIKHFVRQSCEGGEVGSSNQFFESPLAEIILQSIEKQFNLFTKKNVIL